MYIAFVMLTKKYIVNKLILVALLLFFNPPILSGQGQSDFLGQWTGQEDLNSEAINYENRNISILITEGGMREGFYVFQSSCDFLFNENLDWAFHYFRFDKENNKIIFLRRFITPVGILGYEELIYDLFAWSDDYFVAQHSSENRETSHQLRMNINLLYLEDPIPFQASLHQNFPNPFNPSTVIKITSERISNGVLNVFCINGSNIVTLYNGTLRPGETSVTWDGKNQLGEVVANGAYIYALFIDGELIESQRMIFIK